MEPDAPAGNSAPIEIEALLQQADVVSLHLALTDETSGFLDRGRLALLKRGAILVNTARGALIDESALVEALDQDHVARAGLHVFALEPLRADHPLARHDSVTLSAHSGFRTHKFPSRCSVARWISARMLVAGKPFPLAGEGGIAQR